MKYFIHIWESWIRVGVFMSCGIDKRESEKKVHSIMKDPTGGWLTIEISEKEYKNYANKPFFFNSKHSDVAIIATGAAGFKQLYLKGYGDPVFGEGK